MARLRKLDPFNLLDGIEQWCYNGIGHVTAFTVQKKSRDFDEVQAVLDIPIVFQDVVTPEN